MKETPFRTIPPAVVSALLAGALSLPGLAFPFLSDDWALLESVGSHPTLRTPFGDFRPLLMASLWLDRSLWGLSPALFHLTQAGLIALAAALVTLTVERLVRDRPLALGAGLLFACHPYHVETAAWIGSRADPLFAVFFLSGVLAYERWRDTRRGIPLVALLSAEAALLAKESALCLPIVLAAVGVLDPARRARREEWLRGVLPIVLLTLAHFVLRFVLLGGPGRTLLQASAETKLKTGLGFAAAALLPLDPERLSARPLVWGAFAGVMGLALVGAARRRAGRVPPLSIVSGILLGVLILPNVVGFQKRYFFLPAAASAVLLASLLRAIGRRAAFAVAAPLLLGWSLLAVDQWRLWGQAARASRSLVEDLARIGSSPSVREIVVANMPLRVAGGSVGGDLRAALALSGRRAVEIRPIAWLSYPSAGYDALDGPETAAITLPPPQAEVRLRLVEAPFSHFAGPHPPPGDTELARDGYGTLARRDSVLRVRIPPAPERGRAAVAWTAGRLVLLFGP